MTALTREQILALPYVSALEAKKLPQSPGVYCLIFGRTEVVYVGMTTRSIRARWQCHHKRKAILALGNMTIAVIQDGPLADIERETIRELTPWFNYRDVPLEVSDQRWKGRPAEPVAAISPDAAAYWGEWSEILA